MTSMIRRWSWHLGWSCLALAVAGCGLKPVPSRLPASAPAEPATAATWMSLFDGKSLGHWTVLQGAAWVQDAAILMQGQDSDVTLLANAVCLRNAQVEVRLRRRAPSSNAGPFTVGLRLMMQLDWSSLYFVIRPESLEVCRGSRKLMFPGPEQSRKLRMTEGVETWRFVMEEAAIDCYRDGVKVISYADTSPGAGAIALTASKCDIQVLAVRWKPRK